MSNSISSEEENLHSRDAPRRGLRHDNTREATGTDPWIPPPWVQYDNTPGYSQYPLYPSAQTRNAQRLPQGEPSAAAPRPESPLYASLYQGRPSPYPDYPTFFSRGDDPARGRPWGSQQRDFIPPGPLPPRASRVSHPLPHLRRYPIPLGKGVDASYEDLNHPPGVGPLQAHSRNPHTAPIVIIPPVRHEPPYVAINPFNQETWENDSDYAASPRLSSTPSPLGSSHDSSRPPSPPPHSLPLPVPRPPRLRRATLWRLPLRNLILSLLSLLFARLPRQIYLHLLLRLPILYFSRVSHLFEDANLSLPDIQRMAVANADQWKDGTPGALRTAWLPNDAAVPPNLLNFRHSWEAFIDALLREWKTQNVVSALMLSAILTMLQIDAAAADPIARTTALLSLIAALISLLFGSIYIMRFGTMRKMYKAASWADEAQKGRVSILWNVWIMLAIPSVWLAWSIILFVTCIMAFAWRTGAVADSGAPIVLSHNAALGLRIGVSAILGVALVYLFMIVRTFRKYGDVMDKKWNEKVLKWAEEGRYAQAGSHPRGRQTSPLGSRTRSPRRSGSLPPGPQAPHSHRPPSPVGSPRSASPGARGRRAHSSTPPWPEEGSYVFGETPFKGPFTPTGTPFDGLWSPADGPFDRPFTPGPSPPFCAIKVTDVGSHSKNSFKPSLPPKPVAERDILFADLVHLCRDLNHVVHSFSPPSYDPQNGTPDILGRINLWNTKLFFPRLVELVFCVEKATNDTGNFAVYLTHRSPDTPAQFGPLADSMKSITVIHLIEEAHDKRSTRQYEIEKGHESTPPQSVRLGFPTVSFDLEGRATSAPYFSYPPSLVGSSRSTSPGPCAPSRDPSPERSSPITPADASFTRLFAPAGPVFPFYAVKVADVTNYSHHLVQTCPLPESVPERDIHLGDFLRFIWDLDNVMNGLPPANYADPFNFADGPPDVAGHINLWNVKFFFPRSAEAVFCVEKATGGTGGFAVYLTHRSPDIPALFGPLADGMDHITVFHLVEDAHHGQSTRQYEIKRGHANGDASASTIPPPPVPTLTPPKVSLHPSPLRAIHLAALNDIYGGSGT